MVMALLCEVHPFPVEAALNMVGYQAGNLRLPLTVLEEAHISPLRKIMTELGLVKPELFE